MPCMQGAEALLDGRGVRVPGYETGNFMGADPAGGRQAAHGVLQGGDLWPRAGLPGGKGPCNQYLHANSRYSG